jgi:hypothetical protein
LSLRRSMAKLWSRRKALKVKRRRLQHHDLDPDNVDVIIQLEGPKLPLRPSSQYREFIGCTSWPLCCSSADPSEVDTSADAGSPGLQSADRDQTEGLRARKPHKYGHEHRQPCYPRVRKGQRNPHPLTQYCRCAKKLRTPRDRPVRMRKRRRRRRGRCRNGYVRTMPWGSTFIRARAGLTKRCRVTGSGLRAADRRCCRAAPL